jgi:hypothetical protein
MILRGPFLSSSFSFAPRLLTISFGNISAYVQFRWLHADAASPLTGADGPAFVPKSSLGTEGGGAGSKGQNSVLLNAMPGKLKWDTFFNAMKGFPWYTVACFMRAFAY